MKRQNLFSSVKETFIRNKEDVPPPKVSSSGPVLAKDAFNYIAPKTPGVPQKLVGQEPKGLPTIQGYSYTSNTNVMELVTKARSHTVRRISPSGWRRTRQRPTSFCTLSCSESLQIEKLGWLHIWEISYWDSTDERARGTMHVRVGTDDNTRDGPWVSFKVMPVDAANYCHVSCQTCWWQRECFASVYILHSVQVFGPVGDATPNDKGRQKAQTDGGWGFAGM